MATTETMIDEPTHPKRQTGKPGSYAAALAFQGAVYNRAVGEETRAMILSADEVHWLLRAAQLSRKEGKGQPTAPELTVEVLSGRKDGEPDEAATARAVAQAGLYALDRVLFDRHSNIGTRAYIQRQLQTEADPIADGSWREFLSGRRAEDLVRSRIEQAEQQARDTIAAGGAVVLATLRRDGEVFCSVDFEEQVEKGRFSSTFAELQA